MAREEVNTGLALGGLGGNNAHGAGVLQAALDHGFTPDLISCTSGQIYWVNHFLKAREAEQPSKGVLRRALEKDIDSATPTKVAPLDDALLVWVGKPQFFRSALWEFPQNVARNLSDAFGKMLTSASANRQGLFSSYRELFNVWPAQSLVPQFSESFFQEISGNFNQTKNIGIVFNSYDVHSGKENIYLNERARDLLDVAYGKHNRYRQWTVYQPISPEAVREGLWLYEYAKPPRGVSAIDGAYYRDVMLSELTRARTIYVARAINRHWLGSFPSSWIGLQDLKTEVNFNGTYSGERDKIKLMNKLLRYDEAIDPEVAERKGYHHIDLVELEIEIQRGYFDYIHEDVAVFDRAYEAAQSVFPSGDLPQEHPTETRGTKAS